MTQPAIKQRFDRCKVKTLKNLLRNYKAIYPEKDPFHFHCYDLNGHKFIRIELDEVPEIMKEQLIEKKKGMPDHTFIQIHLYEKHAQDPVLIDI